METDKSIFGYGESGQDLELYKSINYISITEFNALANRWKYDETTLRSAWTDGQRIDEIFQPMIANPPELPPDHIIDLIPVVEFMRLVIRGIVVMRSGSIGLGKNSWTIYQRIAKARFPDDPEIKAMKWKDHIFQRFNNNDANTRIIVRDDLFKLRFIKSDEV